MTLMRPKEVLVLWPEEMTIEVEYAEAVIFKFGQKIEESFFQALQAMR